MESKLPDISRSKSNLTMKFDQLIESNTRKVFLEKSQIFEYLENEESF